MHGEFQGGLQIVQQYNVMKEVFNMEDYQEPIKDSLSSTAQKKRFRHFTHCLNDDGLKIEFVGQNVYEK